VLKNSTSPRIGCVTTILAAALPTIQSPPATSTGCPLSEYGWMEAEMIGNLDNRASPAPSAPLVVDSHSEILSSMKFLLHTCRRILHTVSVLTHYFVHVRSLRIPIVPVRQQYRSLTPQSWMQFRRFAVSDLWQHISDPYKDRVLI
jgi:hypothetical protein